jgi:hypothetical protein
VTAISSMFTDKEKARFGESAFLAGLWYAHNQNTAAAPWGGVGQSADAGRFLYEYFPATGRCRGAGVWSQALGACGLLALAKAPHPDGPDFREAAELAAGYLLSLQFLDSRSPRAYGAFREHSPQTAWSYPRDGATGCFGLAMLFRETGRPEYLERANLFCEWFRRHGSDAAGWPHDFFDFAKGEGRCQVPGDWQAGGALAYYYTARAARDRRWLEEGFRPVLEKLLALGDPEGAPFEPHKWHGDGRMTTGNDDFANVALVGGFLAFQDERYLELLRRRLAWMVGLQDEDGSFPNYGSTFVGALDLLDFVELAGLKGLPDKTEGAVESLRRAARFGLSLQETALRDRRAYGGIYGQSSYGSIRDRIHNRDTAYGLHLFLRLAGHEAPCLSALGW